MPSKSRIVFGFQSCTLYQPRLSICLVQRSPITLPRYCSLFCWKNRIIRGLWWHSSIKALSLDLVVIVGQPASVTKSWPLRRRAITLPCNSSSVIGWSPMVVDVLTCVLSRLNLRWLQNARAASCAIFLMCFPCPLLIQRVNPCD